jgi:hypothetical protein
MTAEDTLKIFKEYCKSNSGDEHVWTPKETTYQWSRGNLTSTGIINGVVRKLAGIDVSGRQIWTVAGSLKIAANGTILRFTGVGVKLQRQLELQAHFSNNKLETV